MEINWKKHLILLAVAMGFAFFQMNKQGALMDEAHSAPSQELVILRRAVTSKLDMRAFEVLEADSGRGGFGRETVGTKRLLIVRHAERGSPPVVAAEISVARQSRPGFTSAREKAERRRRELMARRHAGSRSGAPRPPRRDPTYRMLVHDVQDERIGELEEALLRARLIVAPRKSAKEVRELDRAHQEAQTGSEPGGDSGAGATASDGDAAASVQDESDVVSDRQSSPTADKSESGTSDASQGADGRAAEVHADGSTAEAAVADGGGGGDSGDSGSSGRERDAEADGDQSTPQKGA